MSERDSDCDFIPIENQSNDESDDETIFTGSSNGVERNQSTTTGTCTLDDAASTHDDTEVQKNNKKKNANERKSFTLSYKVAEL